MMSGRVIDSFVPPDQTIAQDAGLADSSGCADAQCGFGGACSDGVCVCDIGFEVTPDGQCRDVNECENVLSPCASNERCINSIGDYVCVCAPGYLSTVDGCIDLDECVTAIDNCSDFATCENTEGRFVCACADGFSGDGIVCDDVDECASGTAECGDIQLCRNTFGGYECVCMPGYLESDGGCVDRDECALDLDDCAPTGVCLNLDGGFDCACADGFSGDGRACQDLNECAMGTASCLDNTRCVNTIGSFDCVCEQGFRAVDGRCQDVDECVEIAPCGRNGVCVNSPGAYDCRCRPGYAVIDGQCLDEDECALGTSNCQDNADCLNTPGGYACRCLEGFFAVGDLCEDVDECRLGRFDCGDSAQCVNTSGGYRCDCAPGYRAVGDACIDIDECADGLLSCPENSACRNRTGDAVCDCNAGYEFVDGLCLNIDECADGSALCDANAHCTDQMGSYRCDCRVGYAGDGFICEDVDECQDNTAECPDQLPCLNRLGGYVCGGPALYVCDCQPGADANCEPGDDDNDGRLPASAWRSLERINLALESGDLPAGATVRLCSGGAFSGQLHLRGGFNCSEANPCTVASYESNGANGKPDIFGSILAESLAPDSSLMGFIVDGLSIQAGPDAVAIRVRDGASNLQLVRLSVTQSETGLLIGPSNNCQHPFCARPRSIEVRGTLFTENLNEAVVLTGDHIRVIDNQLVGNGHGINERSQLNIDCDASACEHIVIQGNSFMASPVGGQRRCNSAEILVQGTVGQIRVVRNDIVENGDLVDSACGGIVFGRGRIATAFEDVYIQRNRIIQSGRSPIEVSSCQRCVIENNVVSFNNPNFVIGINVPRRRGDGMAHLFVQDAIVRHNSVYIGDRALFTAIAIKVAGSGMGHEISGNAIVNLSEARTTCCIDQSFDLMQYRTIGQNVCLLNPENANANWALGYRTLRLWQEETGFGGGSADADPRFFDPAPPTSDFRITDPEAPGIDGGGFAVPVIDFTGENREGRSDIGAYEYRPDDQ